MRQLKHICITFGLGLMMISWGCTAMLIGGGATGGYKVATDERTVGDMMDDTTISGNVKSALLEDDGVKGRNIDVDVVNGVVYLTGLVDSQQEVSRASQIAGKTEGVKQVKNYLQIGSRSMGEAMNDKVLVSKVKTRLIGEPGVRSLNIDVDVYRGVCYLVGIADTSSQKHKVVEVARSTDGVKQVVDNIQLASK